MIDLHGYEMVAPGQPLRAAHRRLETIPADEVCVAVAGCGVCHTDLGFLHEGVRTRKPPPLILGHEISGIVVEAGERCREWIGQAVVVPAVIPCGRCSDCAAGRETICRNQVMPGNDRDGGFASHVVVPAHGLCRVDGVEGDADRPIGPGGLTLRHLSIIADAVSTPYQAIARAGVAAGDLVVVIGLGGVGGNAARLARLRGAHVVGLDVDPGRVSTASDLGVELALDPRAMSTKDLRAAIRDHARAVGAPETRWTILECSGSKAGQTTAFSLLVHGAVLAVVGFTLEPIEIRLSNLMAFDARAIGNWGCAPGLYPEIVALARSGSLDLVSQTEVLPLSDITAAFDAAHSRRTSRRLVLVP